MLFATNTICFKISLNEIVLPYPEYSIMGSEDNSWTFNCPKLLKDKLLMVHSCNKHIHMIQGTMKSYEYIVLHMDANTAPLQVYLWIFKITLPLFIWWDLFLHEFFELFIYFFNFLFFGFLFYFFVDPNIKILISLKFSINQFHAYLLDKLFFGKTFWSTLLVVKYEFPNNLFHF